MLKTLCLRPCLLAAGLLLATPAAAAAQDRPLTPAEQQRLQQLKGILASEHPQTGDIRIPAANTTLHLGERYYFLGPADAKRVLTEGWGNPPAGADHVLGIVFPKDKTFADSWGAVLTYDAAGYVSDKDAKTANYDKFLDQARKAEDEVNQQRQKGGFPAIHLVGWAQAPTYDPASHSEVWARQIRFGGESVDTLNYDTRILGRSGVLSLNLVSSMDRLAEARTAANDLARTASFDAGSRYEDYKDGSDKKAEYGIGGLIAAGLGVAAAQKFGLLALIALFAKKAFVLIAAAGAWLAARFRKLTGAGRKAKTGPAQPSLAGPDDSAP
jgi:uncharacterized membrane-anchored protein